MMKMQGICLACLLLAPFSSHATGLLLQGGLHFGGDELAAVTFTNGDTKKLKAGELVSLSAGIAFDVNENFETKLMAGLKADSINAENGGIDFYRYPIDALLMYKASDNALIGAGVTYHLNPSISGDGLLALTGDIEFDNALGYTVEFNYLFSTGGYFGIKLTRIDYELSFNNAVSVDGDSIGVLLGIRFD